jgi:Arc/MetJ-type ribon-helix-helix transcriptional regulator
MDSYDTIPYGRESDMVSRARRKENRKATFSLPASLMEEVRQLIDEGAAPSQSAFVAEALEKEIRAWRTARLREEFHQAAADPDFMRDIDDTMRDFAAADAETARMIP